MTTGNTNPPARASDFLIIGHRGAAGLEPENTLAGFQRALALGADGIELDVRQLDGRLVVFHDDRLERTTDGRGRLDDATFETLRRLNAGGGERVPTLDEVLATVSEEILVNVELKGPNTAEPAARLLAGQRRRLVVSSFSHARLARFRAGCPNTPVAPLVRAWSTDLAVVVRSLRAWSVHLAARAVTRRRVAEVRGWGCRCFVYTVNSRRHADRLRAMGVGGVFTDFPDRLVD